MIVNNRVNQSSVIFETWYDWKDQFLGFIFSQVVQRH